MSNTANAIYQAILFHTTWKKRLHEAVKNGKNDYDVDPHHCECGKWLDKNHSELSTYPDYEKVILLHLRFHQEAEKAVQLMKEGKQQQALQVIEYGSEFEHISQELVKTIIVWRDIAMARKT